MLSVARGGERVGRAGLKGALTVNTPVKLLHGAKHCAEHFPPIDVAERPGNTWGWALSFCRRGNGGRDTGELAQGHAAGERWSRMQTHSPLCRFALRFK